MHYKLTLNKANNLLRDINSRLKNKKEKMRTNYIYNNYLYGSIVTNRVSINISTKTEEMLQRLKKKVEEEAIRSQERFDTYNGVLEAQMKIKNALFSKNVSSGVSRIIEENRYLAGKLLLLEGFKEYMQEGRTLIQAEEINLALIEGMIASREEYTNNSLSLDVAQVITDRDKIDNEINILKFNISKNKDLIFQINNKELIEVDLSLPVAVALGLAMSEKRLIQ